MWEKLLKKPRSTREQYAFWGAVSTTGVIGLVWFMLLSMDFKNGGPFDVDEGQQTASAFSQFFGELKEDFLNSQPIGEELFPADEEETEINTATSSGETEQATSGVPVIVGTSSSRAVLVGTSSEQNR